MILGVAEVVLHLVEQPVLVLPGEIQQLVHLLTVGLCPLEGGVFLLHALLKSEYVLHSPHLLSDVVDLLATSEQEGEDGMEISTGDHLDAFVLVV